MIIMLAVEVPDEPIVRMDLVEFALNNLATVAYKEVAQVFGVSAMKKWVEEGNSVEDFLAGKSDDPKDLAITFRSLITRDAPGKAFRDDLDKLIKSHDAKNAAKRIMENLPKEKPEESVEAPAVKLEPSFVAECADCGKLGANDSMWTAECDICGETFYLCETCAAAERKGTICGKCR